jgi:hypothetical protein
MFGLLRLVFTLAICVLIVGFFLGWFTFSRSQPDPQTNRMNINVSVDRGKMGNDLQHLEQRVNQGIQGLQNPPPPGTNPPANPRGAAPGFSIGPVSFQPNNQPAGQPNGQPAMPGLSIGPFTVQPNVQGNSGYYSPPQSPSYAPQSQDYQYTAPLNLPPPGQR